MATYELGQDISVPIQITDGNGDPADLGDGPPDCLVTAPDGTEYEATVTTADLGLYVGTTPALLSGRYRLTFDGSGENAGALPWSDVVDVWPADPRFIISLADAKAELNHLSSVNDDELRLYIAATTNIVEDIIGAVLSRTQTETRDGGYPAVMLNERAVTVESVQVNGVDVDYVANLSAGIIYGGTSVCPIAFYPGRQNVVVTYTTGGTSIDPNVILAARIITAHLYQTGQQSKASRRVPDDAAFMASGYAVPARAMELLKPSMSNVMPGLA